MFGYVTQTLKLHKWFWPTKWPYALNIHKFPCQLCIHCLRQFILLAYLLAYALYYWLCLICCPRRHSKISVYLCVPFVFCISTAHESVRSRSYTQLTSCGNCELQQFSSNQIKHINLGNVILQCTFIYSRVPVTRLPQWYWVQLFLPLWLNSWICLLTDPWC